MNTQCISLVIAHSNDVNNDKLVRSWALIKSKNILNTIENVILKHTKIKD